MKNRWFVLFSVRACTYKFGIYMFACTCMYTYVYECMGIFMCAYINVYVPFEVRVRVVPFSRCVSLLLRYGTGTRVRGLLGPPPAPAPDPVPPPKYPPCDPLLCCDITIALRDKADSTSPIKVHIKKTNEKIAMPILKVVDK